MGLCARVIACVDVGEAVLVLIRKRDKEAEGEERSNIKLIKISKQPF